MRPGYKLSKRAEKDLAGIWRYTLDTWSQEQANKYLGGLLNACEEISKAPAFVGRSYEHIRSGYRKYSWGKHVIFYQIQCDGTILISRILHEKMDYDRHL